ncbi:MAG TPA: hypothetical protein VGF55_10350 [Gemmataceae bacterium]|jgi:hypothetical protein
MPDQPRFRLLIQAVPNHGGPLIVRLRHAMKPLLRTYSLRCVSIEELPSGPAAAGAGRVSCSSDPSSRATAAGTAPPGLSPERQKAARSGTADPC